MLPGTVVTAVMAGAFLLSDVGILALTDRVLGERDTALVAMAVVAVAYMMLREWVWRLAQRVVLGRRPDFYATLATLARRLEVTTRPDEQLAELTTTAAAAFRIVSEALTNVARHANARNCEVTLTIVDLAPGAALRVLVRDDGDGIPDSAAPGIGMVSLRERAGELGGECAVATAPGGGTELRCLLPCTPTPKAGEE